MHFCANLGLLVRLRAYITMRKVIPQITITVKWHKFHFGPNPTHTTQPYRVVVLWVVVVWLREL